jgi:HAD superfamily hydrolase (TIGR01509 family)
MTAKRSADKRSLLSDGSTYGVRVTSTSRLESVIFDVDGTLVDSERDGHRVAFNAAFEEAGFPDRWDVDLYGELLSVAGGAARLTHWFERTGRDPDEAQELAKRLHVRKTAIMRQLVEVGRIHPRPGARELIDELASRGVAIHVATTGTREWVAPLLQHAFGDRFDTVMTGTDVPLLKPDPAVYLEVLGQTGAQADRTVVIEDSANGLRAAVAAGLQCLVARNDYTRGDDFTGATLVTEGLDDPALLDWIRRRL